MADAFPLLGLHDSAGGEFLAQQNIRGWCLDTIEIGLQPRALEYTALSLGGVRVIAQLTFGANPVVSGANGGAGTLPTPDQYSAFANAVVNTIRSSSGVYAFVVGNEPNRPDQWPNGNPITPEQYGLLWNMIWFNVPSRVSVIPAPIDPYYGPTSDSRDYWARMMQAILAGSGGRRGGVDGLMFHPQVQWHDKSLVRSDQTFTDPPLLGLPYHWKVWQALYAVTPSPFRTVPIYLSHCRAASQTQSGPPGWRDDDDGLIAEMIAYEREHNIQFTNLVSAVILYRWNAGPWTLNRPSLIAAMEDAAKDIATTHLERLSKPPVPFSWPTESRVVTQPFGINRDFYAKFGLPGHEGVDIQAATGSKVFAAYEGFIRLVQPDHPAYGYSIRQTIQWNGHTYELVYAHGVSGSAMVQAGATVRAGQLLMLADSTGNAFGAHLHFSMKEPGIVYMDTDENGNQRTWPFNLRDPSAFLGI